jgi:hypothetical protein
MFMVAAQVEIGLKMTIQTKHITQVKRGPMANSSKMLGKSSHRGEGSLL